jgi:hypothetical protein
VASRVVTNSFLLNAYLGLPRHDREKSGLLVRQFGSPAKF